MGKAVVKTSYGSLRGSNKKSDEGYNYYAFKGIPYAKPPVNELRFQDPQPPDSWKGIRDATEYGPACAQFDQFARNYIGSDDCLYLNVYTRSINSKKRVPVMVYIHGGAFTFGCGDDLFYGPDYLLRKDVVLVTINYRLGVFGFLNLEDEIASGNQGFKDQVMALKWVQANIANFGGDPTNVTIFGESSGGSCVNYLGLSPMADGLFHKAISQSGVAVNTWATIPTPKLYAHALSKYLGKETEDSREILEFLKTVDSLTLAKAQENIRTPEERYQLLYPFGPGIDDKSTNPFMPVPVSEAAKKGMKVPYLLGYNNREGIYATFMLKGNDHRYFSNNYNRLIHPHVYDILKEHGLTTEDLLVMYDCTEVTAENYIQKYTDVLGDMYVVDGYHKMIKYQVLTRTPVYFYKFTYDQGVSFTKLMLDEPISGASHFDELPYLFSMRFYKNLGIDSLEKGTYGYKLMEQMTEMWTNFAKTGKPTPHTSKLIPKKWGPVTNPVLLQYLEIGNELTMNSMFNLEQRLSQSKHTRSKL